MKRPYESLRSARWFAPDDFRSFGHRSRVLQMGYSYADWMGIAGDRDRQHLERCQPVPRALQATGGGRQARHPAGGRLPARASGDLALGKHGQAHHHALPQLPGDGNGRAAAQPPGGRRGAHGGLRQDHARPRDGRTEHGHSLHLPAGRPHAARQLEGQGAGLGLRRLQVLGRAPRRAAGRAGPGPRWRPASPAATAPA